MCKLERREPGAAGVGDSGEAATHRSWCRCPVRCLRPAAATAATAAAELQTDPATARPAPARPCAPPRKWTAAAAAAPPPDPEHKHPRPRGLRGLGRRAARWWRGPWGRGGRGADRNPHGDAVWSASPRVRWGPNRTPSRPTSAREPDREQVPEVLRQPSRQRWELRGKRQKGSDGLTDGDRKTWVVPGRPL